MKKWCMVIIGLVAFAAQAPADEISDLKNQLAVMQNQLARLEQQQAQQNQDIKQQIAQAVGAQEPAGIPDSLKWAQKIKFSGDIRYRHESIDDDTAATDRDRNRIRARLQMKAKINDEWSAAIRLASGSSDSPTSTNQTLGDSGSDSFSSKAIWLDRAYVDYHPASIDGLNVLLGKMGNPFYKAGGNQMIYDGDLSLEGVAATYDLAINDSTTAAINGGGFWVRERSTDADTSIFGIQGLLTHTFDNDSALTGGASYYDFGNIEGKTLAGIGTNGNSNTAGVYDNDYNIVEGFAQYAWKVNNMPMAAYGSYVKNIAADSGGDTGWIVGCSLNKAKKPGSWQLSYNYRDVEPDAVVGGLCDSDFAGGGTDGRGHAFGFKYQIVKNVQAGVTYFLNEQNVSAGKEDFKLLQADLIVKF